MCKIAVVDADQRGAGVEHALQILRLVQLHQRRHAQLARLVEQLPQIAVVEALGDQQHRVGPGRAGFDQLIRVENEILAQHGQPDGRPNLRQSTRAVPENTARPSAR